jgi:hypothetical protein
MESNPLEERSTAKPASLARKSLQFSISQLLAATALVSISACLVAIAIRSGSGRGGPAAFVGASAFLAAAVGTFVGRPVKWALAGVAGGSMLLTGRLGLPIAAIYGAIFYLSRSRELRLIKADPSHAFAIRQQLIYRLSAIWSLVMLYLWLPMIFTIPSPGHGFRPMIELPVSCAAIPIVTFIQMWRAVTQFEAVPQNKWVGMKAVIAAVVPLLVFAATQWWIFLVLKSFYES